jgi:hypothetical protein
MIFDAFDFIPKYFVMKYIFLIIKKNTMYPGDLLVRIIDCFYKMDCILFILSNVLFTLDSVNND